VIVANGPPSWIASRLTFVLPGLNPLMRGFKKPAVSFQPSAFSLSVPGRTSFEVRSSMLRHEEPKAEG
jgi:hypothetical protein